MSVRDWPTIAAFNNAEWCDTVCRTHGIEGEFSPDAWTSASRTPAFYPDAVTLVVDPSVPDLLSRVDPSPGCSIKDSFASLDLTAHGFRLLFDAQWILREPTDPHDHAALAQWTVVDEVDTFATWVDAWRGADGPHDVLRAELLRMPAVTVLAAWNDDHIVGGAVLHRTRQVVGISNYFANEGAAIDAWSGCLAAAGADCPGAEIVGYESGDALTAALASGFEAIGPLRVWVVDD
jgi:hypothetical protein